jgi:hypothetical protein
MFIIWLACLYAQYSFASVESVPLLAYNHTDNYAAVLSVHILNYDFCLVISIFFPVYLDGLNYLVVNWQIVVWRYLHSSDGPDVLATKNALVWVVLCQYIPRLLRIFPVTKDLKRTAGVFIETAWAGAGYYLLWFMLAGHVSFCLCLSAMRIFICRASQFFPCILYYDECLV